MAMGFMLRRYYTVSLVYLFIYEMCLNINVGEKSKCVIKDDE